MKKLKQTERKKLRTYRATDQEEKEVQKNYKKWIKEIWAKESKWISLSRYKVQKMLEK